MQYELEDDTWQPRRSARLRVERLERRLPLAANVAVDVSLSERLEGLNGPETAITGLYDPMVGSGASVASFPDGSHVFVFGGNSDGNAAILGRRTLANGQPATPTEFTVSTLPQSTTIEVDLAVVPLHDGEFLAVWSTFDGIFATHVDRFDQPLGPAVNIGQQAGATGGGAELAVNETSGDAIVIAWIAHGDGSLRTTTYDPISNEVTPHQVIATGDSTGSLVGLSLQAYAWPTELVAVWTAVNTADSQQPATTFVQPISHHGSPVGSPTTVQNEGFGGGEDVAETLQLSDGSLVQLIERYDAVATQIVLQHRNPDGGLVSESTLGLRAPQFSGDSSITLLDGQGGFVVSFVRSVGDKAELVAQQFSQSVQPIGSPAVINQSLLPNYTVSLSAPLADGGYVVYWVGLGLDQQSSVIMNRVQRMDVQDVILFWDDPQGLLEVGDYQLRVDGVPASAGFSHAIQVNSSTWTVGLSDASWMSLLLPHNEAVVDLNISIVQVGSQSVVGATRVVLGAADDDMIHLFGGGAVDGGAGEDTVVLANRLADYSLIDYTSSGFLLIADLENETLVELRNVERLQFVDQTIDLTVVDDLIPWFEFTDFGWPPPPIDAEWLDDDAPFWDPIGDLPPPPPFDAPELDWIHFEQEFDKFVAESAANIGANIDDLIDLDEFDELPDDDFGQLTGFGDNDHANAAGSNDALGSYAGNALKAELGIEGMDELAEETAYQEMMMERFDTMGQSQMSDMMSHGETQHMEDTLMHGDSMEAGSDDFMMHVEGEGEFDAADEAGHEAGQDRGVHHSHVAAAAIASRATSDHPGEKPHGERPSDARRAQSPASARRRANATPRLPRNAAPVFVARNQTAITPSVATSYVTMETSGQARARASRLSPTFVASAIAAPANFDIEQLFTEVDTQTSDQVAESVEALRLVAGSAVVVATGFSMANLAWLLRGSVVLTNTLTSLPIWVGFDPLPLLDAGSLNGNKYDDESLIDIASNPG